jgi:hypothetical protein
MTVQMRRRCKKCRYDRCLRAGMIPEAVLDASQKKIRFRKLIQKKRLLSEQHRVARSVTVGNDEDEYDDDDDDEEMEIDDPEASTSHTQVEVVDTYHAVEEDDPNVLIVPNLDPGIVVESFPISHRHKDVEEEDLIQDLSVRRRPDQEDLFQAFSFRRHEVEEARCQDVLFHGHVDKVDRCHGLKFRHHDDDDEVHCQGLPVHHPLNEERSQVDLPQHLKSKIDSISRKLQIASSQTRLSAFDDPLTSKLNAVRNGDETVDISKQDIFHLVAKLSEEFRHFALLQQ